MADSESSTNLEQISTFSDDRIQTETAVNGTTVFIHRIKPKDEAGAASVSAADLPDDFTVNTVSANSAQIYYISFGPLVVMFSYDLSNLGAAILVWIPILAGMKLADVSGNLKNGLEAAISYLDFVNGKVGVRLDGSSVVLYWDLVVVGVSYKDEVAISTI